MQTRVTYNLLAPVFYHTTGPAHFLTRTQHCDLERRSIFRGLKDLDLGRRGLLSSCSAHAESLTSSSAVAVVLPRI